MEGGWRRKWASGAVGRVEGDGRCREEGWEEPGGRGRILDKGEGGGSDLSHFSSFIFRHLDAPTSAKQ